MNSVSMAKGMGSSSGPALLRSTLRAMSISPTSGSNRISIFDKDGKFLGKWGKAGFR